MKKTVFILLLAILSIPAFSQKGDYTLGLKSGYVYSPHSYSGILYGFDAAYLLSDQFEVVFTGMTNPSIPYTLDDGKTKSNDKLAVYSANLDFRLYLIHMQTWATGPALGGQYYIVNNKTNSIYNNKALGFNLGWHVRVNLTDNLILNGGWRYTNSKAKDKTFYWDNSTIDISYNLFYIGIAYMFGPK